MNVWDIVLILAIACAVFLAAKKTMHTAKHGRSCCGDCSACKGCGSKED